MDIKRVCALYYSATGNTDKLVNAAAEALAAAWAVPLERFPLLRPADRERTYAFGPENFVVAGSATYAGRLPNKIWPQLTEKLSGGGALAACIVTFGNRAYDNSLSELQDILERRGFHTVAGAAFVGRHAFTDSLGTGRPDWDDRREIEAFCRQLAEKVKALTDVPAPVALPGDPEAPYYVPKGTDGAPVNFLKAKPKTHAGKCTNCGACARLCPMGAIEAENVFNVPGTCIKCQCCVRRCTKHAKYFDDPVFLSHVAMLEQNFQEPKRNEVYI